MRTTILALAVILAGAVVGGCSPAKDEGDPGPVCRQDGVACSLPSQCCSGACNGTACIDPATSGCKPVGWVGCTGGAQCCTGACENGTCVEPAGSCELLGQACTSDGNCCSGDCDTALASPVCKSPPQTCRGQGATCSLNSECCSFKCGSDGKCTNAAGICKTSGTACGSDTECCSLNCPGAPTPGATCSSAPCRPSGTGIESSCSDGTQCCSGLCSGGKCSPVPAGPGSNGSCTTLGETCNPSADTCCSQNCQNGTCFPASYCNAPGDVCWRAQDCCSGLCTVSAGSATPGRCQEPTGSGCTQDGSPCDNDSNCCTRKCVDLGSGQRVCQPAGGCRMTGNYCDSSEACCGGHDEATGNPSVNSKYGVYCDTPGSWPNGSETDPSNKDNRVCTSGQSCNPPGNICGGSGTDKANASQNCCNDFGSGKDVCKPDLNNIMRCFGSPSTVCTTSSGGYDGGTPGCCIADGEVCQFRDQCCNYAPCVPDAAGVLRCEATSSCLPRGARCSTAGPGGPAPSPDPCCGEETCQYMGSEVGWACRASQCKAINALCAQSSECCIGSCVSGQCRTCTVSGTSCTTSTDCCSGICTGPVGAKKCSDLCVPEEGICTATSDCCPVADATVSCVFAPGSTTGVCTASVPPSTCAGTGESCATKPCCSGLGNECNASQICALPPAPTCGGASQACTGSGKGTCCDDLWCRTIEENPNPYDPAPPTPCSSSGTYCACEGCSVRNEPCSTTLPCCLSSDSYCVNPTTYGRCTSSNSADCRCLDLNM